MRFERYDDGVVLLELVNAVEAPDSTEPVREYTTAGEKLEQASDGLRAVFEELEAFVFSLGDDVQKKELKYYFAYKRIRNFVCVYVTPDKERIHIYLKIEPDELDEMPEIGRDVTETGHYGTGNLELTLTDMADLEASKEYIEMSYEGA